MKFNDLAIIIVVFIIVSFLLSLFNIISITLSDILSYSLLIIGVALVYGESIRRNRLLVFLGSVIFLLGVYFLVSENFNLNINGVTSIPIILIFAGSGLLILHISTSTKIIFLIISVLLLSAGMTLFIVNSRWNISSFFQSFLPVLNFLWPVIIIVILIALLLKIK
jgi:hypothetical protein